jgi:hypothetical protein
MLKAPIDDNQECTVPRLVFLHIHKDIIGKEKISHTEKEQQLVG